MIDGARLALRRARFRHKTLRAPLVRWRHHRLSAHDVFLAAYPRSGTTWLRFLFFETLTGQEAAFGRVRAAVPSVGEHRRARPVLPDGGRLVQTHERYRDGDRRVVYVVRDVRSVVVSEYAWQRRARFFTGTLEGFIEDFLAGRTNPWGTWDDHIRFWGATPATRSDRVYVLRYEDLRRSTEEEFTRALTWLGAHPSAATVRAAIHHNSLEAMRAKQQMARAPVDGSRRQPTTVVGAGSTRAWRASLAPEQIAAIERRFGPTLQALGYELETVV